MVKFIGNDLIANGPDPLSGVTPSETERLREVVANAVLYEQLGFDGFSVGERHHPPFLSSSPPVVLSHIAARTSKIRLFTGVTLLPALDPVRVAEDYATLDHLSGGHQRGLTRTRFTATLELFQSDVAPELRRTIPDPPWPEPIADLVSIPTAGADQ